MPAKRKSRAYLKAATYILRLLTPLSRLKLDATLGKDSLHAAHNSCRLVVEPLVALAAADDSQQHGRRSRMVTDGIRSRHFQPNGLQPLCSHEIGTRADEIDLRVPAFVMFSSGNLALKV